jgi:hypothetical protein
MVKLCMKYVTRRLRPEEDERDSYGRTNSVMATSTAILPCVTSIAGRDSSFAKRSKLSGSSELCEVSKASCFTDSALAQTEGVRTLNLGFTP